MPKNCSRSHENKYDHENFLSEPSQDDPDPTLRAISCTLAPDELPSNERTPLLSYSDVTGDYTGKRVRSSGTRRTPLPLFQVSILLFLQLSEPVTSQSIYPFINELIRNLDVTGGDERKVGYYAGLVESTFFASEALTVLYWSHLSDIVGRRPILLVGFAGLTVSMIGFGLSKSFLALLLSRSLAGLLNGISGVIKSMMGEVTDYSNMAQAFAYMPVVWSVGATIGPFIGGELSRPADGYPKLFKADFWKKYPYFLPCIVVSIFPILAFILIVFFLKETARPVKSRCSRENSNSSIRHENISPGSSLSELVEQPTVDNEENSLPTIRSILTHRVLLAVLVYALLSFIDMAFLAVEPLFYATSISNGGVGLSPAAIGLCLGIYGILMGIFQATFFTKFQTYLGSKKLLILALCLNIPIFSMFPLINLSARTYGMGFLTWSALVFQLCLCVISDMGWGCAFIFVTLSAPDKSSLGATNGLASTLSAAMRAVGPAATSSLFAATIQLNLLNGLLVYIVLIGTVIITLFVASFLPDNEEEWETVDETLTQEAFS